MTNNPKGRPPSDDSARAQSIRLSRVLGFTVTPQQVRWWQKKRYSLDDHNRLRRHLLDQERLPEGASRRRLKRDLEYPPQEAYGRMVRELLEEMPGNLIDLIDGQPRKVAFAALVQWVQGALREVVLHEACPPGLALNEYEPDRQNDEPEADTQEARRREMHDRHAAAMRSQAGR